MFIRSTAGTTPRELPVDDNRREASDAEPHGQSRSLVMVHVANMDLVLIARDVFHHFDGLSV